MAKVINVLSAAALGTILTVTPIVTNAQVPNKDEIQVHTSASNKVSVNAKSGKTTTTTPIKHVVVIFGENVSFDHYFGTYPYALNVKEKPQFFAKKNTPEVNNLLTPKDYNGSQPGISKTNLITNNPNGANPVRLDRSQAMTPDMDHSYQSELDAVDGGKMDKFVTGTGGGNNIVMDYYDGNTVTAMWNYAQNFAMSDNFFGTVYGPSTPGALNVISGNTRGAELFDKNGQPVTSDVYNLFENGMVTGDADPHLDHASSKKSYTLQMKNVNKNIGDLLNAKGITWGWFEGGFANPSATHTNVGGSSVKDYSPHHEPFQYYASTANPDHKPPSSTAMIGKSDQANHQYDINDFWKAVDAGNMPSVSYLKAPMYEDGHAGYSDPLDEQRFIVDTINKLEKTPEWKDTAVIITYDDSDGWYDHAYAPSNGRSVASGQNGYGPRLPLLVISPYAKSNFVDHTLTNQTSIVKFIEDNWNLGRIGGTSLDAQAGSMNNIFDFKKGPRNPKLFLNATTGEPVIGNR
ncbi:phospholipase C [Neobacillus fumarioli]|uniref:phospholipase C n=1 Tax=Neobacillus fumarioli TaxID=105229 RepID=UPI00082C4073|nr:alkaline phosphatase family protein [Neobacillus fumarioli]